MQDQVQASVDIKVVLAEKDKLDHAFHALQEQHVALKKSFKDKWVDLKSQFEKEQKLHLALHEKFTTQQNIRDGNSTEILDESSQIGLLRNDFSALQQKHEAMKESFSQKWTELKSQYETVQTINKALDAKHTAMKESFKVQWTDLKSKLEIGQSANKICLGQDGMLNSEVNIDSSAVVPSENELNQLREKYAKLMETFEERWNVLQKRNKIKEEECSDLLSRNAKLEKALKLSQQNPGQSVELDKNLYSRDLEILKQMVEDCRRRFRL